MKRKIKIVQTPQPKKLHATNAEYYSPFTPCKNCPEDKNKIVNKAMLEWQIEDKKGLGL